MTKSEQMRFTNWRLRLLQAASSVGNVARTCRHSAFPGRRSTSGASAIASTAMPDWPTEHGPLRRIADTLDRERQCCQFLRFQLTIEPAGGAIVLDLTGPEGTRDFLKDLTRD